MVFKDILAKIRDKIVEMRYYAEISISVLVFLNFALLITTASDKLRIFIPLGTIPLLLILVPGAFILIIFLGWFLDKVVKYQEKYYKMATDRNPQIVETLKIVKNIEKELLDKMDRIEKRMEADKK